MRAYRILLVALLLGLAIAALGCTSSLPGGAAPSGDSEGLIAAAEEDMEAERYAEAAQKLQQATQLDADNARAYYLLGNAHAKLNQFPEAEQTFLKALEIDPSMYDARANLGVVLYQQNKFDRAREAFEAVLAEQPDDAEVHYNLGGVLAAQNQLDAAIEHFQRATVLDPELAEPYLGLGSVYRLQGNNEQAIAALKQYLQRAEDPTWRQEAEKMIREMGGAP